MKPFWVINSFSGDQLWGNPAAVFCDAEEIDDAQLQGIAKQLNLVETVFVYSAEDADFTFRYFTPSEEVAVAGHPTVAACICLAHTKRIDINSKRNYRINTQAGVREVVIEEMKRGIAVRMKQAKPIFSSVIVDRQEVAQTLGIDEEDLITNLPVQSVDSGLHKLIVPVKSLDRLMALKRNIKPLQQLCQKLGVRGIQAFTFEAYNDSSDLHTRNICPKEGIEDPACGMGNAALGAYFAKYNLIETGNYIIAEQGAIVDMPSQVEIFANKQNEATDIYIGGTGRVVIEGSFYL